jgi:4-amino-4-deoxy-L-arabinose transferase-like glycosyltransferase
MALFQSGGLLVYAFLVPNRDWRIFGALLIYSILAAVLLVAAPQTYVNRLRAFLRAIAADERRFRIVAIVAMTAALLGYMAVLPIWIDEAASFEVVRSILDVGVVCFFTRYGEYQWLGVQHPPLAPLIYSASASVFGPTLLGVRLPNLIFASIALLATYEIGKLLLDRESAAVACALLPAFPLVFRMMAIANNDLLVILCMTLAVLSALRLARAPSFAWAAALGLSIGAGMVAKYTMVFGYPVALGIILLHTFSSRRNLRAAAVPLAAALLISLLLPGAWFTFQASTGLLDRQIDTLRFYVGLAPEPANWNVPGATAASGAELRINWISKHLPLGIGVYNMPILLIGLYHALRSWSRAAQTSLLWAAVIMVPVLALLPQPRYLLPAFPALALLAPAALVAYAGERTRPVLLALCYCPAWLVVYDGIERSITL